MRNGAFLTNTNNNNNNNRNTAWLISSTNKNPKKRIQIWIYSSDKSVWRLNRKKKKVVGNVKFIYAPHSTAIEELSRTDHRIRMCKFIDNCDSNYFPITPTHTNKSSSVEKRMNIYIVNYGIHKTFHITIYTVIRSSLIAQIIAQISSCNLLVYNIKS